MSIGNLINSECVMKNRCNISNLRQPGPRRAVKLGKYNGPVITDGAFFFIQNYTESVTLSSQFQKEGLIFKKEW